MNDEYIRLDTTIIAIDRLINEAATGTMARTLFKAKDTLYSQQRYVIDVQPVKRGRWEQIGEQSAKCTACGGVLKSNGIDKTGKALIFNAVYHYCPNCGARMIKDGDTE
ncbi:MAG: hypothetical protein IIW48_11455 [Clostridia bacterium]|nr:hypothetical protein [Clostridia bacterium]